MGEGQGKSRLFQARPLSLREEGVLAGALPASHQKDPDWPLKITSLGKVGTANRLGIKSQFGDVGLTQVTPFGDYYLLKKKKGKDTSNTSLGFFLGN